MKKNRRRKLPTVRERCLGREKAMGQMFRKEDLIEIDPRLSDREYFKTLIHELIHRVCPHYSERQVISATDIMFRVLWRENYRKVKQ